MLTVLMIFDALVALTLIASVLAQSPKSAGMGGMDGGGDTVFSGKARGMDALLARVTVVFAILFCDNYVGYCENDRINFKIRRSLSLQEGNAFYLFPGDKGM